MKKLGTFGLILGLFLCVLISGCGSKKGESEFVDG